MWISFFSCESVSVYQEHWENPFEPALPFLTRFLYIPDSNQKRSVAGPRESGYGPLASRRSWRRVLIFYSNSSLLQVLTHTSPRIFCHVFSLMRNNSLATYCRWIGRSICLAVATGNSPYPPSPPLFVWSLATVIPIASKCSKLQYIALMFFSRHPCFSYIYIYRMPVKNESNFSLFWSHWGWLVLRIRQGFVWLKLLCWTSVEHLWIASMCRLSPRDTYSCYDVFHLLSAHWVADWCFCLFMYSHT